MMVLVYSSRIILYNGKKGARVLNIVAVVDKEDTAIDRLARGIGEHMNGFHYEVVAVHPKRPDLAQLQRFEDLARMADIIDFQYYRTAEMLLAKYDWLKDKKKILTMYNPYGIHEGDWNNYDQVIACNKTIAEDLKGITNRPVEHIPLAVSTETFAYNTDWQPNHNVIMVANRIESKKGILEVAKACDKANLNLILVGAISDASYFNEVVQVPNVTFAQQVSDEELVQLYYNSTIHVCNSIDNFESGTLPILEAMLTGVPVVTRNVGHVPDLFNGENMVINPNEKEDVDALADLLSTTISDVKAMQEMREKAWQTAKNFTNNRRAMMYQRIYRQLQAPETPVSVIMPICDNWEVAINSLNAIAAQDYPNMEVVIVDDSELSLINSVYDFSLTVDFPVQYYYTYQGDYGLARARNTGIINATGQVLVFCDQRQRMDSDAVSEFVANLTPRIWLYGNKGGKKDFVENFSCIYRDDIIRAGMFNERCNKYGAMSQEVRARTRSQGITHQYCESAKATAGKSSNKYNKKAEIIASKDMLWRLGL